MLRRFAFEAAAFAMLEDSHSQSSSGPAAGKARCGNCSPRRVFGWGFVVLDPRQGDGSSKYIQKASLIEETGKQVTNFEYAAER